MPRVEHRVLDVTDAAALSDLLGGKFAVLSAAPYHLTYKVAEAARAAGAHYLDLTEDVASTRKVKALAADAPIAFIPQCGLAPGFISIVAADLASHFDDLHDVRLRVGALPKYPSNALNYNLTWSTDGVINEYCEPCEAIVDGLPRQTRALEENEAFSLDGVTYEAFNTSGGLGTLCETLAGKVRNLNYRTIRYPGHAAIMKALLNDLRPARPARSAQGHPREVGAGHHAGRGDRVRHRLGPEERPPGAGDLRQQDLRPRDGRPAWSAPSRSPPPRASARCSTCWRPAGCRRRGFVRQEEIGLGEFLANRFGSAYASAETAGLAEAAARPQLVASA